MHDRRPTLKSSALNPHQVHIVTTSPEPLALVFTDMVGSSAAKRAGSLGQDATARDRAYLESIQSKHLKLIRDAIAEHKGTEIMTIGDSFFLTFEDVVDAVRCSAAIQQRLRAFPIDTPSGPCSCASEYILGDRNTLRIAGTVRMWIPQRAPNPQAHRSRLC